MFALQTLLYPLNCLNTALTNDADFSRTDYTVQIGIGNTESERIVIFISERRHRRLNGFVQMSHFPATILHFIIIRAQNSIFYYEYILKYAYFYFELRVFITDRNKRSFSKHKKHETLGWFRAFFVFLNPTLTAIELICLLL